MIETRGYRKPIRKTRVLLLVSNGVVNVLMVSDGV